MDLVPVRIHLRLSNIERAVRTFEGESPIWSFPTYLWTVFFKVDGDTVYVDDHNYKLQGSATIVGTPGDHGDLPGNGDLSNTAIPSQIGEFRTVLTPIPIRSMDDPTTVSGTVSGSVGCAAILMWQRDTPADAVAQGHQTLNSSFQSELNTALSTLGPSKRDLTDADIQAIEDHVANAVTNAIENALSPGEKFLTVLGIEHQDHRVGSAIYRFSADELMTSAPEGISSLNGYPKPTQITIIFTSPFQFMAWGFHGTIIADPLPISLKRVLVGLGYQQPLPGLREAMGTFQNSSVSAWVAAVR